jgi:hypothetical protein
MADTENHLPFGVRFRIGDAFPADQAVARFVVVLMMALNDLLPLNERLTEETDDALPPHERLYLARLVASHLFELATFLEEVPGRFQEIDAFLAGLLEEAQEQRRTIIAVAKGQRGEFADQLERLRNHFFHYARLLSAAPEQEELLKALAEHANRRGEIRIGKLFKDFRARFADDIAAELTLTDEDAEPFVAELAELSTACMNFAYAVIGAYTDSRPEGTFESINESRDAPDTPSR